MRIDGRAHDALREIAFEMGFQHNAGGSCLVQFGQTRVLCAATCEEAVPPFLLDKGTGWLTAEYNMLPGSTLSRKRRPGAKPDGRSVEIQRLIGRSLRAVVDFQTLGPRTIHIDCDVIDADGGTRTAAITGAWCAAYMLCQSLVHKGVLSAVPIKAQVAAVSCGVVDNEVLLDLCYAEDSRAQVDLNLVRTSSGDIVEIQGTGEGRAFTQGELMAMLQMAGQGIDCLMQMQMNAVGANDR